MTPLYQHEEPPTSGKFAHFSDTIPAELKVGNFWVCCDAEKVPMLASTRVWQRASSTNPLTWRTYEAALEAYETGRFAGLGRVFEEGSGFVGIDLDNVRNPHTGQIDGWVWEILESLDSYSEVSPSGKGIKVWVRAELERSHKKPGLEIYRGGRYFTVTGQILSRYSGRVEERTLELRELVLAHFPPSRFTSKENRKPYDGSSIELVEFLEDAGVEFREIPDVSSRTFAVVCPWWSEHSDGDKSGTRVGQYVNGALWFKCEHAHCAHRRWGDFRRKITPTKIKISINMPGYTGTPLEVNINHG